MGEALTLLILLLFITGIPVGSVVFGKYLEKQEIVEKAREKALKEGRYDELLADKSYSYSIKEQKLHRHEFVLSSEKTQPQNNSGTSPSHKNEYIDSFNAIQKQLPMHQQEKLAVANMYIDKIYKHDPNDKFFKRYLPLVTETLEAAISAENNKEIGNTAEMLSTAARKYYAQITGKSMMTVDVNKSVLEQLLTQDGLYNTIDDILVEQKPSELEHKPSELNHNPSELEHKPSELLENKQSEECVRLASVSFPGSTKQYDYICEPDSIKQGDRVIVDANGREFEVTVAEIRDKNKSDLELPINRYKPIIRKAEKE